MNRQVRPLRARPVGLVEFRKFLPSAWSASVPLNGVWILLILYTLYVARAFILPMVLAAYLTLLFQPLVRALKRLHLPDGLIGALILLGLVGTLALGIARLKEPASNWIARMPKNIEEAEQKINEVRQPAQQVTDAAAEVARLARGQPDTQIPTVQVKGPGLGTAMAEAAKNVLAGIVLTLGMMYFLLASGDSFLRKWVNGISSLAEKKQALAVARELVHTLSTYLATITGINIGLGMLTSMAMWLCGMPNPILWGVVGGSLNFIPYLGALAGVIIFAVVGVLHFDDPLRGLLPALIYWVMTALEGWFITPVLVGQRLRLSPALVFASLIFWGWLWGIPGTLLAVPILLTIKIFCDHTKAWAPIGAFIER